MKNKKKNNILFAVESTFFGFFCILFFILSFFDFISAETANIIYIAFMIISFGWLIAYEFIFEKYDNAVHFKFQKSKYVPTAGAQTKKDHKRQGIVDVILLWIAYLAFIGLLKYFKILNWQLFLSGASFMFLLNSVFTRKACLLSILFLHNKNNCCKNCTINCWDYAIFASALIFAPYLSICATILNVVILVYSAVMMIIWEYNYHKYPYRFVQETNKTLSCKNCLKQCKYK